MSPFKLVHIKAPIKSRLPQHITYRPYGKNAYVFSTLPATDALPVISSVKYAESIVHNLLLVEGLEQKSHTYEFYDLRTHIGHPSLLQVGEYAFTRLLISWKDGMPVGTHWEPGHCSEWVLHHFAGLITGNGDTEIMINNAEKRGHIRPRTQCVPPTSLGDLINLCRSIESLYPKPPQGSKDETREELMGAVEEVCRIFCDEIQTPHAAFLTVTSKTTSLGPTAVTRFCEVCDWLIRRDSRFLDLITPTIFFN